MNTRQGTAEAATACRAGRLCRLDPGRGRRRRAKLPGPVYRREVADPCRRPRRRPIRRRPNGKGGVRLATLADEVRAAAEAMIGHTLVTKQTGPAGRMVRRVYVEAGCDIERELYLSLLIDRSVAASGDRLHRRRHGDRGGRRAQPGEDPARRRRSGLRHFRLPRPQARLRPRPRRQAGRAPSPNSSPRCTRRSWRWTARSSRSTRWS